MEKDQRTDNQRNCRRKQSSYERELRRTRSANRTNRWRLLPSFSSLEFLRNLWIAQIVFVEINNVQAQPVLHFPLAQVVQVRLPVPILGQILRHMPGQKNMSRIAAIQHPLGDIYSRSCKVRFIVYIGNSVDWATVNSHPYLNVRMILQGSADLERTAYRFFRAAKKKKRHPVSSWQTNEFAACLRRTKAFGASHDRVQFLEQLNLLIDQQLGITDHVD